MNTYDTALESPILAQYNIFSNDNTTTVVAPEYVTSIPEFNNSSLVCRKHYFNIFWRDLY